MRPSLAALLMAASAFDIRPESSSPDRTRQSSRPSRSPGDVQRERARYRTLRALRKNAAHAKRYGSEPLPFASIIWHMLSQAPDEMRDEWLCGVRMGGQQFQKEVAE